jgi:DNA repair protein RAD57
MMTDLLEILPDFNFKPYSHLIHSLEKTLITVSDLITLDPAEIVKACPLPLGDVRNLVKDVVEALQESAGISTSKRSSSGELLAIGMLPTSNTSLHFMANSLKEPGMIKTLDPVIDEALGGGFHTGCITEIAGER